MGCSNNKALSTAPITDGPPQEQCKLDEKKIATEECIDLAQCESEIKQLSKYEVLTAKIEINYEDEIHTNQPIRMMLNYCGIDYNQTEVIKSEKNIFPDVCIN